MICQPQTSDEDQTGRASCYQCELSTTIEVFNVVRDAEEAFQMAWFRLGTRRFWALVPH